MPSLEDLTIQQQRSLRSAAVNLQRDFDGVFSIETIEQFLATSYDQFADQRHDRQLPSAHGRTLRAATPQGAGQGRRQDRDGLPIVLFLCVHNAGRSQMALGWFNHLAGDRAVAWSGGSEPGNEVNPPRSRPWPRSASTSRQEFPKPWTDEIVHAADVVVTMGCGDACPLFPGKRYEDWELDDPAGQTSTPSARSATRSNDTGAGSVGQPRGASRLTRYRLLLRFNRAALGEQVGLNRRTSNECKAPRKPVATNGPRQRPTANHDNSRRWVPIRTARGGRKTCGEWALM